MSASASASIKTPKKNVVVDVEQTSSSSQPEVGLPGVTSDLSNFHLDKGAAIVLCIIVLN